MASKLKKFVKELNKLKRLFHCMIFNLQINMLKGVNMKILRKKQINVIKNFFLYRRIENKFTKREDKKHVKKMIKLIKHYLYA